MFVWMPANCDLSFCFRQAETLAGLVSEVGRTRGISVTGHAHGLRGHMYLFLGDESATHPLILFLGGERATYPLNLFGGGRREPFGCLSRVWSQ